MIQSDKRLGFVLGFATAAVVFLLLAVTQFAHAQGTPRDSAIAKRLKVVRDSVYCTTSSTNGPKCTRAKQRLDSIRVAIQQSPITPPPPPPIIAPPIARFTWTCNNLFVCDLHGGTSSGSIKTWLWNLNKSDDGSTIVMAHGRDTLGVNYFDGGSRTVKLTVTDSLGRMDDTTQTFVPAGTAPPPPAYDSTASIAILLERPPTIGESVLVCGVFTTKTGAKGLMLLTSIQSDSTPARLSANLADTTAAPCLPIVQRAAVVLTPGLAPRAGTWMMTKVP